MRVIGATGEFPSSVNRNKRSAGWSAALAVAPSGCVALVMLCGCPADQPVANGSNDTSAVAQLAVTAGEQALNDGLSPEQAIQAAVSAIESHPDVLPGAATA